MPWAVCAVLALTITACSSEDGSAATTTDIPSAASLVSTALRNAVNSGWVHEVDLTTGKGQSLSMVNDIGSSEGRQVIVADGGHATVIVLDGKAYIRGDVKAIASYFELPSSDPAQLAGKWISLVPSDPEYSAVSDAVTLRSDFNQIKLEGPFSKASVSLGGQDVTAIHGYVPGPSSNSRVRAVLDITAEGTILPVAFQASDGQLTESLRWSKWGDAVSLVAPQDPKPVSQLGG